MKAGSSVKLDNAHLFFINAELRCDYSSKFYRGSSEGTEKIWHKQVIDRKRIDIDV